MERAMVPKMQSATLCVLGAGMSFPISAEGLVCFSVRLRFPFVGRAPPSAAMHRTSGVAGGRAGEYGGAKSGQWGK